ncbi:MAG: metallophosphoesterase [Candidatus Obscuribacterales bacterium]|jgi:predicted MPP superfamily phosphohydrolase|nr:metallophosphoesterase [Candidatus Obscuribacterales bacterium]
MPLDVISTVPFGVILVIVLGTILWTYSKKNLSPDSFFIALFGYAFISIIAAFVCQQDLFDCMRLLCIAIFYGGTLLLFGLALIAFKKNYKRTAIILLTLVIIVIGIGIDAFLVEPKCLETKTISVESEKITSPIKIAVLSDLQTDKVSDYEKMALQKVLDQKPDIILLPGDYVQLNAAGNWQERELEIKKLNNLLAELKFSAKSGTFAVQGNVDDPGWTRTFKALPIKTFINTSTEEAGEVFVTGLSFEDSFNPKLKIPSTDRFQIVFGHGPDFSLGKIDADLLVAGHTHGGQVRIPGLGALITFSSVPQNWGTGGFFEIRPGSHLLVTTGVGHERYHAPRLRFFCHPEIVMINISPKARAH